MIYIIIEPHQGNIIKHMHNTYNVYLYIYYNCNYHHLKLYYDIYYIIDILDISIFYLYVIIHVCKAKYTIYFEII